MVTDACPWSLQWRHNEYDNASNHRRPGCLPYRLFRRRSKKTSKFHFTGLCERNQPVTGGFPSQRASNTWVNRVIVTSDNVLLTVQYWAITWTSDELLSIGILWTNFGHFIIKLPNVYIVPFYSGLSVLILPAPQDQYPRMVRIFLRLIYF